MRSLLISEEEKQILSENAENHERLKELEDTDVTDLSDKELRDKIHEMENIEQTLDSAKPILYGVSNIVKWWSILGFIPIFAMLVLSVSNPSLGIYTMGLVLAHIFVITLAKTIVARKSVKISIDAVSGIPDVDDARKYFVANDEHIADVRTNFSRELGYYENRYEKKIN